MRGRFPARAVVRRLAAGAAVLALLSCGPELRRSDLQEIVEAGRLRILVRPGFGGWPEPVGLGGVEQSRLLEDLAGRLGVELQWIQVERHDQLLTGLIEGLGDVALGRFSVADLDGLEEVRATATVDWLVDEVVSTQDGPVATVDDLAGVSAALPRSFEQRVWGSGFEQSEQPVEVVPETVPFEQILEQVGIGRYAATVADSALVESVQRSGTLLRVVQRLERRSLVWALRRSSPQLLRAIDDFLFASAVLDQIQPEPECRDLREIQRKRVLRLVTRNSPVTVAVERGGLAGFEYDLVSAFARDLGVRLELALPPPGVEPAAWLEEGFGDLAALHEPPPVGGARAVRHSVPYRWVDLVAVVDADRVPLYRVDDLSGLPVTASPAVGSWADALPLEPPMVVAEAKDAWTALVAVAKGETYAAIVDQDTAKLELSDRQHLVGDLTVLPQVPLVWMVSPGAPELSRRADRFLARSRRNGLIRQLEVNHFGSWSPPVPRRLPTVPPGALSPFDELLRWAGRRHEIDWRLLASVMYEESRFDPDAVGPGGSAGLFQFMPFTWKELGVDDPHHPHESVEAGARYLRRLMDLFPGVEMKDRVAMAIAGYNVGPGHVFDARRLARQMGFDPDRWSGNVETAMVILDDPEVGREYPSGICRCRRAVGYTRRILRRYAAYRVAFPPS